MKNGKKDGMLLGLIRKRRPQAKECKPWSLPLEKMRKWLPPLEAPERMRSMRP